MKRWRERIFLMRIQYKHVLTQLRVCTCGRYEVDLVSKLNQHGMGAPPDIVSPFPKPIPAVRQGEVAYLMHARFTRPLREMEIGE